jgi:hypothetical protein
MWLAAFGVAALIAGAQQVPVPQPFPRPGSSQPAPQAPSRPAPTGTPSPAAPRVDPSAPTEATLGVPVFPNAQFIASYDAGRGQRYYVFGSGASFVDLVNYYRTVLKQKGDVVFEVPATHEFDIGKFNDDTMAFPPSVTIKDFQSSVSQGYPNPKPGVQPAWFPTIIQIVPPPRPGQQN